jgi:transcriptional antiterminator NusG
MAELQLSADVRRGPEVRAGFAGTERTLPWVAVQTRPNYEQLVARQLTMQGHECFLPVSQSRRRWSDRVKTLDLPLFPGYLFCRCDMSMRWRILSIAGVTRILGCGGMPIRVSEEEIAAVQRLVHSGLACMPSSRWKIGERVRVQQGPLRGLEGFVMAVEEEPHLFVSVSILQRSIAVKLDAGWLSRTEAEMHQGPPMKQVKNTKTGESHHGSTTLWS